MNAREKWSLFADQVARQGSTRLDGMMPVAVFAVSECRRASCDHAGAEPEDGHIDPFGAISVMWPPGLTKEQRLFLLERAAKECR